LPKQDRALVTRAQLIQSARTIFARDGFEQARIEDIAALSGKTRGAFYANFTDKEDVFFAIFEEDIASDQEKIRKLLRGLETAEQRVDALAAYLSDLGRNCERTLLALEFKLYAIRRPHRRKRLAELHSVMRLRCSIPEINEFLPELDQQSPREKSSGSLAIGAIMDGLALNRLFDPETLDDAQLALYLRLCVRETLLAARPDAALL
jgi:AcrR family transcriptional regulator